MNFFVEEILSELHKSFPLILKNLLFVVLYFICGYIFIKLWKKFLDRVTKSLLEKEKNVSVDFEARLKTINIILKTVSEVVIFLVVVLTSLGQMGVSIGPLLTGLGIVGVAVGFGAQYLIKDLIAGFFIILEDQIRVGEFVKIDNSQGVVESISLRTTKLRAFGGEIFIIPNGTINIITNMSRDFVRAIVEIDLPYSLSPDKAYEVLEEAVNEAQKVEDIKNNLLDKAEIQGIIAFENSAVKYRIIAKMKPQIGRLKAELAIRKAVLTTLNRHNIEIPYPQMDVHIDNKVG